MLGRRKTNQAVVIARISSRKTQKKPTAKTNSSKKFVPHGSRYGMNYLAVEYINADDVIDSCLYLINKIRRSHINGKISVRTSKYCLEFSIT